MRRLQHSLVVALALIGGAFSIIGQTTERQPETSTETSGGKQEAASSKKVSSPFVMEEIWTVHLTFSPDQWTAMEPTGGPGAPGQRGGRPGGFGPAMFLAPTFLTHGDTDQNGKLSESEFQKIGEKWFGGSDTETTGRVTADQLRKGLNITLAPPAGAGGMPGMPPGRESFLQGAEGKRNGVASAMGIEFKYVHADLEFEGEQFKDVAVRFKGNGTFLESRGALKRSLKVDLNKYVKGQKLGEVTTLNLHSSVADPGFMNEVLAHRLYRDAGVPAPRTAYARVFLTVPGKHERQYLGLYSLVEDINKKFETEHFGTKKGAIFKPVTPRLFHYFGDDWAKYKQTYDPKDDITVEDAQRVIEFSRLVTQANDAEFAEKLPEFLDLDAFARYLAVTVWLSDLDGLVGPGQNYYLHLHPKTRKFSFIGWDQDHSFGYFPRGSQEQRERLSIHKPWQGENRFLERVFAVEAFKKRYLETLQRFSTTLFKPERFHQQVDTLTTLLRPAVQEESEAKLARFDRHAAGEMPLPAQREGGPGGGFGGPMPTLKPLKPFVQARAQSVIDQLSGTAEGLTIEGFGPPAGGRPRDPGAFGPGNFIAPVFMAAMDMDKDGSLTREEFAAGFSKWFTTWDTDYNADLTDEQLRAGIDKDFAPPRGGRPGPPAPAPEGETDRRQ